MATAADFVEALVEAEGWPERDVTRVVLATSEAVANAVEHGGGVQGEPSFTLSCTASAGAAEVTVHDGGPGPAPALLRTATLPEEALATGGRGLSIMRQLADEVAVVDGRVRLRFKPSGGGA